ncbi:MAG: GIY-YIG nuclease family protein [Chitinivibrionales bacterium]|nr:GIY-YIG nuclease family protein [Chitinivibrionales bacterium]
MTNQAVNRKAWYVYLVRTVDGRLYAGIATDVDRRFREHCAQGPRTARYLRAHKPRALVFAQRIGDRSLALKVEYRLKRLPRSAKLRVVDKGKLRYDKKSGSIHVQ